MWGSKPKHEYEVEIPEGYGIYASCMMMHIECDGVMPDPFSVRKCDELGYGLFVEDIRVADLCSGHVAWRKYVTEDQRSKISNLLKSQFKFYMDGRSDEIDAALMRVADKVDSPQ